MRNLLGICVVLLVTACSSQSQTFDVKPLVKSEKPALIASAPNFFVYGKANRIYVIESAATQAAFEEHGHLPYTHTVLGAGPHGETVIFEVNKKDDAVHKRLEKTFMSKPLLVKKAEGMWVYSYHNRHYVVGKEATNTSFVAHKHLPYTHTVLGAGPAGKTVVYEIDKKDPEVLKRLLAAY